MYLTRDDKLNELFDLRASDTAERLAAIKEAHTEALAKMTAALDEFIEVVDRERTDGKDTAEVERRTRIEMLAEQLAEVECDAVRCLESGEAS